MVRLKLRLVANQFRRSPWQVVGLVIAIAYGAFVVTFACAALLGLRLAPIAVAREVVVLGGSITVFAFLVVPLLLGVDDALDPRRFALFGIDRSRLATGLAIASVVGIPGIALVIVTATTVVTWTRSPAATLIALIAFPLTVVICSLLARLSAATAGLLLSTRRSRDTVSAIVVIAMVLVGPLVVLLTDLRLGTIVLRIAAQTAEVLAWTPLGASWAAPATIAAGDARGLLQLLIAIATAGLLWVAWRGVVARVLVSPSRHAKAQTVHGLGWLGVLPSTPLGAVAARCTTYWARDVRYRVSALVIPLTPVVLVLVLGLVDVPGPILALIPVPVVALFTGWLSHNDIAYDSTAIWLHIAAGVRGTADRLGRLAPVFVVGVPLLVAGSVVSASLHGDLRIALGLIGVSLSLFLVGSGLGGITSALLPYPVPRPGASPFQQPNAAGGVAALVQSVLFLLQVVLSAPAIVCVALGLLEPQHAGRWFAWALVAGLVSGGVIFAAGTAIGARVFSRRGAELLAAAIRA